MDHMTPDAGVGGVRGGKGTCEVEASQSDTPWGAHHLHQRSLPFVKAWGSGRGRTLTGDLRDQVTLCIVRCVRPHQAMGSPSQREVDGPSTAGLEGAGKLW